MLKSKIVIVAVAVLSLLNSVAFAQESSKPDVNVSVIRDGVKIEQMMLSKGFVQIRASHKRYDEKKDMYELTDKAAITIIQNDKYSVRLVGKDEDVMQVQAVQIEDQIDVGSNEDDHFRTIRELSKEVQAYPLFTSYRVKWYFGMSSYHSAGVALYDRKAGTITEYIQEANQDMERSYYTLFSGVTDKVLSQMAQDVKDKNPKAGAPNQTAPFDFGNLTRYGCKAETPK
ncbi:MAG: hypothetical protein ABI210_04480 [Abditibacteriaceae bacterium]